MRKGFSIFTFLVVICGLTLLPQNTHAANSSFGYFGNYENNYLDREPDPSQLYRKLLAVTIAPTITDIPDQTINEDSSTGAIGFQVGDAETPVGDLVVSGSSSNPTLVPNANITLGGVGADRTVTVTPAGNQFGSATITITVTDGDTDSSLDTFQLTVNSVNDLPSISDITNKSTSEDTPTSPIPFTISDVETAEDSLGVSGVSSNLTLVPNINIVFGGSGGSRTITITPASNQIGTTTITVTVTDGNGGSVNDSFDLTVTGVNDLPTISDITDQSTNEDTATLAIPFTIGDNETPAGNLVVSGSSSNTSLVPIANIVFGGSGSSRNATITPALNQYGSTIITITVTDGDGGTVNDTFVLNVIAVNDPPTISNITDKSTNEDTSTPDIPFTVNDVEDSNASLSISGSSSNTTLVPNGNISFGGSGSSRTVTITPASNQIGSTTITVTVTDGDNSSASDTFVLTVISVNDLPSISNITNKSTNEDMATGAIPFTVDDTETLAGDLIVSGTSSNTSLVPNNNIVFGGSGSTRNLTITPAPNQFGSTTITVTVTDSDGGTANDSFVLNVSAINDLPIISNITDKSTNEDTPTSAIPFTVTDIETPDGSLSVSGTSSNTALVPNGNVSLGGTGSARTVTITPALNQFGTTTITITVSDGSGGVANDSFLLTVNPIPDLPTISDITDKSTNEDTPTSAIPFTINDAETPAASLNLSGSSSNTLLVPNTNIVFGGSGSSRNVTITPALNQFGSTTISVTVTDGDGGFATDTFLVTVNPVSDPPTISDITDKITNEDTPTSAIPFAVGDVETPTTSLTVSGTSSNTTLIPNTNITFGGVDSARTVQVNPASNQFGSTTITVTVTDGDGASTSDTFLLTVNSVNDLPTITDVLDQFTDEDTPTPAIPFTITDIETLAAELILTGSSSNPLVVLDSNINFGGIGTNRTVSITPNLNAYGSTTITLTATDLDGGFITDTFLLTVNPILDLPTITNIPDQVTDEDTPTSALPFTVGDAETLPEFLIVQASSSNQTLVPNSNITTNGIGAARTITVSPDTNQTGVTTITVTVTDGDGGTATDSFSLTVNPINDPAVALGDFYEVIHDKTLKIVSPGILANDSDVDGDTLIPFLVDGQGPSHGTLTLRNNGSFDYKPDSGFIGSDSFQYFVSDDRQTGSLTSNIAQVSINIYDVDSPRVSWMLPVKNGEQYEVECEKIELEVEATDDLNVNHVVLSYYDYEQKVDVPIVTLYSPPYKTNFNTCVLNPEFNQINAIAYDSAGNNSGYPAFIWLYLYGYKVYLPTLEK